MDGVQTTEAVEMARYIVAVVLLVILGELLVSGCLITNCPKGGKRNGKFGIAEGSIKPVRKASFDGECQILKGENYDVFLFYLFSVYPVDQDTVDNALVQIYAVDHSDVIWVLRTV